METTVTNVLIPRRILKTIAQLPAAEMRKAAYMAVRALSTKRVRPIQVLLYLEAKYGCTIIAPRIAGTYRARPNNEMTNELPALKR